MHTSQKATLSTIEDHRVKMRRFIKILISCLLHSSLKALSELNLACLLNDFNFLLKTLAG